jgi:two-component system CheB/CheR fusion protein
MSMGNEDTGKSTASGRAARPGDEPALEFEWTERDGPPVAPPMRIGFGTELIKNSITFELGGKTDLQFLRQGLRVRSRVPLRSLA